MRSAPSKLHPDTDDVVTPSIEMSKSGAGPTGDRPPDPANAVVCVPAAESAHVRRTSPCPKEAVVGLVVPMPPPRISWCLGGTEGPDAAAAAGGTAATMAMTTAAV